MRISKCKILLLPILLLNFVISCKSKTSDKKFHLPEKSVKQTKNKNTYPFHLPFYAVVKQIKADVPPQEQPSFDKIVKRLKDEEWEIRLKTVKSLGSSKKQYKEDLLIALLKEEKQYNINREIVEALKGMGTYVVEPLLEMLKDNKSDIDLKRKIISILSGFNDSRVKDVLINMLNNNDRYFKRNVANALEELNWEPTGISEKVNYYIAKGQWDECVELGEPAAEIIIKFLLDKDHDIRKNAVKTLDRLDWKPKNAFDEVHYLVAKMKWSECVKIGEPAIAPLVVLLTNNEWYIREHAAETLDRMTWKPSNTSDEINYLIAKQKWNECVKFGEKAVAPLIDVLTAGRSGISENAVETLGKIGSKDAADAIANAIENERHGEKFYLNAAEALERIGDIRFIDPLIRIIDHYNKQIREKAGNMFVKAGKPVIEPLLNILKNENSKKKRKAIADILDQMKWQPDNDTNRVLYLIAREKWDECVKVGAQAIKPLINELNKQSNDIKWEAFQTLLKIKDYNDTEFHIMALEDTDWRIQWKAIEHLKDIDDPRIIISLINKLNSENLTIQKTAENKLIELGELVVNELIAATEHQNKEVRGNAIRILGKIKDSRAIDTLQKTFKNENGYIRKISADALDELNWKPESTTETAYYYIAKKQWDKCAELGKPAIKPLISVINDEDWRVKKGSVRALTEIENVKTFVKELLNDKDENVRVLAKNALTIIDN